MATTSISGSTSNQNIAEPGVYDLEKNGEAIGSLVITDTEQHWYLAKGFSAIGAFTRTETLRFKYTGAMAAGDDPVAYCSSIAQDGFYICVDCATSSAARAPGSGTKAKPGTHGKQIDPGFYFVTQGGFHVADVESVPVDGASASTPGVATVTVEHWYLYNDVNNSIGYKMPGPNNRDTTLTFTKKMETRSASPPRHVVANCAAAQ